MHLLRGGRAIAKKAHSDSFSRGRRGHVPWGFMGRDRDTAAVVGHHHTPCPIQLMPGCPDWFLAVGFLQKPPSRFPEDRLDGERAATIARNELNAERRGGQPVDRRLWAVQHRAAQPNPGHLF